MILDDARGTTSGLPPEPATETTRLPSFLLISAGKVYFVAWEWVAPVAAGTSGVVGVFFTWLTGAQARRHTEEMVSRTRDEDLRVWRLKERRDAYLAALKFVDLHLRRERYKREGKERKLADIDRYWPADQRRQMSLDATIGVQAFGSSLAQVLLEEWRMALDTDDFDAQTALAVKFRQLVTEELNPEGVTAAPPRTGTSEQPSTRPSPSSDPAEHGDCSG